MLQQPRRLLGYERVHLSLYKVADAPFHIQGGEITIIYKRVFMPFFKLADTPFHIKEAMQRLFYLYIFFLPVAASFCDGSYFTSARFTWTLCGFFICRRHEVRYFEPFKP